MNDTIAAIATPHGVGGIAIVRLAGDKALQIIRKHIGVQELTPRKATYTLFSHQGREIDEVVVTYFQAPHSYTGDDTVEISCHGSQYVQQAILEALISDGARLADAGEYTRRAFVSGHLNLSQAEAVADLIDATSAATHQLAMSQLRGAYAKTLAELRDQFVEITSLLELELDFSDEDLEFADRAQLLDLLTRIEQTLRSLADSYQNGNAIKEGVNVAIIGPPNAGKSTLLNALVGEDRAIVSNIPGTTRDTIEEGLTIEGVHFRFVDTAGLRATRDPIEKQGINRSLHAASKAAVVLLVTDQSTTLADVQQAIDTLTSGDKEKQKRILWCRNKCDLLGESPNPDAPVTSPLSISARTGEGLNQLRQWLVAPYRQVPQVVVTNLRHFQAIQHILKTLPTIRQGLKEGLPADLVVVDIREALYHLGTITGQVTSTEVLHSIFSRFCIGK